MTITQPIASHTVTGAEAPRQTKLADAAQQFEAMMTQELLKPFSASHDGWGGEAQDADAGADTMNSFGTEAVAKAIAKNGGLGIARQVIRQVTREDRNIAAKKP